MATISGVSRSNSGPTSSTIRRAVLLASVAVSFASGCADSGWPGRQPAVDERPPNVVLMTFCTLRDEKLLTPPVVEIRIQPLTPTQRGYTLLAPESLEDNPDLLFG